MTNWLNKAGQRRWGAWNCAFYAMVAVAGFITLNVAGCGGGGNSLIPLFRPVNITIQLRDNAGNVTNGTGTVRGGVFTANFTTNLGAATVSSIPPGTYTVTVTAGGITSNTTMVIGADNGQSFVIVPGLPASGTLVTGRIFLNRGDPLNGNCANPNDDQGVTAKVLIRARRISDNLIIASFIREQQAFNVPTDQRGKFVFPLPAGAFRIEVRQAPPTSATESTAPITGNSPIFNLPATSSLVICANEGSTAPGGTPTPTATTTPLPTSTPLGGPTPTNTPVGGPTATPTTVPVATNMPTPRPTATNTPGGPPPNPTFTPAPTFTPTPSTTSTPTVGPPPPPSIGRPRKK